MWLRIVRGTAWSVLVALAAYTLVGAAPKQLPQQISPEEAEILVYVMPASAAVRKAGCDVTWELQRNREWNQKQYYIFWVVHNGKSPGCRSWPTTVGYFAVNRYTADVRNVSLDDFPLQQSAELARVQEIIRRARGMDATTIQRYRYTNPEAGGADLERQGAGKF